MVIKKIHIIGESGSGKTYLAELLSKNLNMGENMGNDFLKYWFNGFEASLNKIDDRDREIIFEECGKACSNSYTRKIYLDEYKNSSSINEFLEQLMYRFPEIKYKIIKDNEIIELTYCYCGCDLVKSGYITSSSLCECSKKSLQYNWESVLGKGKVKVKLLQSILEGSSSCKFEICILK